MDELYIIRKTKLMCNHMGTVQFLPIGVNPAQVIGQITSKLAELGPQSMRMAKEEAEKEIRENGGTMPTPEALAAKALNLQKKLISEMPKAFDMPCPSPVIWHVDGSAVVTREDLLERAVIVGCAQAAGGTPCLKITNVFDTVLSRWTTAEGLHPKETPVLDMLNMLMGAGTLTNAMGWLVVVPPTLGVNQIVAKERLIPDIALNLPNLPGFPTTGEKSETNQEQAPTPLTAANPTKNTGSSEPFGGFKQGTGDPKRGQGNCAAVAVIKAADAKFGDQMFKHIENTPQGRIVTLRNGETVTVSDKELDTAMAAADFGGSGMDSKSKSRAYLAYAVMAKESQRKAQENWFPRLYDGPKVTVNDQGQVDKRGKKERKPRSYEESLQALNDGEEIEVDSGLLGIKTSKIEGGQVKPGETVIVTGSKTRKVVDKDGNSKDEVIARHAKIHKDGQADHYGQAIPAQSDGTTSEFKADTIYRVEGQRVKEKPSTNHDFGEEWIIPVKKQK